MSRRWLALPASILVGVPAALAVGISDVGASPQEPPQGPPAPPAPKTPPAGAPDAADPAAAAPKPQDPAAPAAAPAWMVAFEETPKFKLGMDPSDINAFLDKQVKTGWKKDKGWEQVWERVFLLMTPAHEVEVPAFWMSKYEVTNAQWEAFLRRRSAKYVTKAGDTLEGIASALWSYHDLDRQRLDIQRGWTTLLATNDSVLMPVVNEKGDPKWDPLVDKAAQKKLPAGLELTYSKYPVPPHWKDGKVPDAERRRPARFLSWEQCVDFCEWAGFHLPYETEWERAARGTEGRWFPWGDQWEGTRAVWRGFNDAANAAVAAAKEKGGASPVQPLDRDPPEPVEVDSFPQGATPEGIHHLIGNVSEFVANGSARYPGSKALFKFSGSRLTRGGNCEDRAEVLLAADRNAESHQGALLAGHAVAGYGFRLAAYPVAGADIAAPVAEIWSDRFDPRSPANHQPLPPGIADVRKAAPYWGFELQNTAGVIERALSNEDPGHVFVVGAARGVAFLPVKGFPNESVKGAGDVSKLASDADRPLFLGLLVSTANYGFRVKAPQTEGAPADIVVSSKSPDRLFEQSDERVYTKADVGLMLVLEGDKVVVYPAESDVKNVAKYRTAPLGYLADAAKIEADRSAAPSSGAMEGTEIAVLSAKIPLLGKDGSPQKGAASIRVTIRVPVVPQ